MPGQDIGTNNPRHYAKIHRPPQSLMRRERQPVRGPRRLAGDIARRVVFVETLPAFVKNLLPMLLRRLNRRRRRFFCPRNSFAIVRRSGAYQGNEENYRKSPTAFCKYCPRAQRFRLEFTQEPPTLVRGLHDDTCSEKKFCCRQPTA